MDDEQQGAWWTTPPRDSTRPGTRRAGPPDDEIEVRTDAPEHPDAEPSLFTPMPSTGQTPVVRPPVIRPPVQQQAQAPAARPLPPPMQPAVPQPLVVQQPAVPLPPTAGSRVDIDPPTRPVEYLTVRLDPEPAYRGFGDTMDVPAAAMPRMRPGGPDEDQAPAPSFPRGLAILLGVGVLVVIVVVAVVASVVATGVDAGQRRNASGGSASTAATLIGGTQLPSLTQVSAPRARALLISAGGRVVGSINKSFTWDDDNGTNLLVTETDKTPAGRYTLTVVHAVGLERSPRILRTMTDPNLPECTGADPLAGFTAGSMFVRDLDNDGKAEVTIGWSSRCGKVSTSQSVAKLAVLSDGRKYIIRGEGEIGGQGSSLPDPVAARWPKGFRAPAVELYKSLYF